MWTVERAKDPLKFTGKTLVNKVRLIGELLVYHTGLHRRRPHSSNIISSETAGPTKVKFHMEPPWDWGTKVC